MPPLAADEAPSAGVEVEAHDSRRTTVDSSQPETINDPVDEDKPDAEEALLLARIHALSNRIWTELGNVGVTEQTPSEDEESAEELSTQMEQQVVQADLEVSSVELMAEPVQADGEAAPMLREFVSPAGRVFRVWEADWIDVAKSNATRVPLCDEYGQHIEPHPDRPHSKTTLWVSDARTFAQSLVEVLPLPVAAPSSELPVGPGGHHAGVTDAGMTDTPARQSSHTFFALGERGRADLTEEWHLDPATIDAFSHELRENPQGEAIALHGWASEGEAEGPEGTSFHGTTKDGPGGGYSLWLAVSQNGEPMPQQLVVAESFIDALSIWEMIPADVQPYVGLASTGGTITAAGEDLLERALVRMVEFHRTASGITPILLDATDVDEITRVTPTAWLNDLAERAGGSYRRIPPAYQVNNWNEELQASKAAVQGAQEVDIETDDLIVPDKSEVPQPTGKRPRPRGR